MNQPNVISINPGVKTRGAIREEGLRYGKFPARVVSGLSSAPRLKDTLNFLSGINTKAVSGVSPKLALLRIACGVGLIIAVCIKKPFALTPVSVGAIILSVSLICGLFTRIITFCALPMIGLAISHGMIDIPTASCIAFAGIFFMILGPGIYSLDQLLRRAIFRKHRKRMRHRCSPSHFSYKAYVS